MVLLGGASGEFILENEHWVYLPTLWVNWMKNGRNPILEVRLPFLKNGSRPYYLMHFAYQGENGHYHVDGKNTVRDNGGGGRIR